jgi:glycine/D-amino acid oxidase-like deaminating enzyme
LLNLKNMADVVVVGAGIVGAACAYYLVDAGLDVTVVDRGPVAGGTTGAGEGNLLVSDKPPGPELDLMLVSLERWAELDADVGGFEFERKGGLMVAATDTSGLDALAESHRAVGVVAERVDDPRDHEPALAPGLAGGAYYPQDAQVQPALAAARLLHAAGVAVRRVEVSSLAVRGERVVGVHAGGELLPAEQVVNAAGVWAGALSRTFGAPVPVEPRRGFVLVTEPMPPIIRHKVYAAEYLANVASGEADLQSSAVVEGTPSGTILIGASRERVGFDSDVPLRVLRRLAAQAVTLFPVLAGVHALRAYRGFRPYSAGHLPIIGPDPRRPGLYHACGHEGAGIGLAPATGALLTALITGAQPSLDPAAYAPVRFAV